MAKKLIKNYVRRTEKLLPDDTRPDIPISGTNHIDDSNTWTDSMVYKGEISLDMSSGTLYSQDGTQPVEFNTEDGIVEGLILSTSGVSTSEIGVSPGKIRIDGRLYRYNSVVDVDDASISIAPNNERYDRLDLIAVRPDMSSYDPATKLYGVDFEVVRGNIASDIPVPQLPDGHILLGLVLVVSKATAQDVLRPLSVTQFFDGVGVFSVTPERLREHLTSTWYRWSPNTLYLKDQLVNFDNNAYKVAYTHVSGSSLSADINNRNTLSSLGAMTNSNISVFSDIGSDPTTGQWINQYFDGWNSNTRILDAFYDLSSFVNRFAPEKPNNISDITLSLSNINTYAGVSTSAFGTTANNVVDASEDIRIISDERFEPYSSGTLKTYLYTPATSYSTIAVDLSDVPETLPNVVSVQSGSNIYTVEVDRDDHYGVIPGYKGFYDSVSIDVDIPSGLLPSSDSYRFEARHLTSDANAEVVFHIEDPRDPVIANVSQLTGVTDGVSLKYMSGIPVLKQGDFINIDLDVEDAVRYFYKEDYIVSMESEISANSTTIGLDDTSLLSPSSQLPFTALTSSTDDGPVIEISGASIEISANVVVSTPQIEITAYNSLGGESTIVTPSQILPIDDMYDEVGVRLFSGDGDFPAGSEGVNWGNVYTEQQSQEDLMGNQELQYFGGRYFYPQTDYSSLPDIVHSGSNISYPDYSNNSTTFRWSTFFLGSIQDQKYYNFRIRDTSGIGYDLLDGVEVTANLKVYLRVNNESNIDAGTGWLDMNKSYNSTSISNPEDDGDPALDLSWMEGNPNYRRATFGTEERTGNVFVRIGTTDRTISFKDAVEANIAPEENDGLWNEFNLGYITGESYVTLKLNGTSGTVISDFLNGTTMSSNFDIQVRVQNDINSSLSTDWIDANEAYPANSFIPKDYGDPALDLTYYSGGFTDPIVRKVTFGPTTRTGYLVARVRYTPGISFGNVELYTQ